MKPHLLIVLFLLMSAAGAAHADTVVPIQYNGQGSAIIFSNFFFVVGTFDWDVTTDSVVPGTMVVSSSGGTLGTFTFTGVNEIFPGDYYFDFIGSAFGDKLGLNPLCFPGLSCFPGPSMVFFVNEVVGCVSSTCINDDLGGSYSDAVMSSGAAIQTPEPSSVMLLCGGLAVLLMCSQEKKRRRSTLRPLRGA